MNKTQTSLLAVAWLFLSSSAGARPAEASAKAGALAPEALAKGAQAVSPFKRLAPKPDETATDEALRHTLSNIRAAFLTQNTDRLADSLTDTKVFLSLRSAATEPGFYTRSQMRFIFQRMFRELRTKTFGYSPDDLDVSDGRAFVRTEWTYTPTGADAPVTERLLFSLEKDQNSWVVCEIKAAPR